MNMFSKTSACLVFVAVSGYTMAGCSDSEARRGMPSVQSSENCLEATPDECRWASSFDAVIYGEIQSLEIASAPMRFRDAAGNLGFSDDASVCESTIIPALHVGLRNVSTLFGDDRGETIEVTIGSRNLSAWSPQPTLEGWSSEDGALNVGQEVGMPVIFVGDSATLAGGELFWKNNGVIEFQQGSCSSHSRAGMTFDGFEGALDQCEQSQSNELEMRRARAAVPGILSNAANCTQQVGLQGADCRHDSDCLGGESCAEGRCNVVNAPIDSEDPAAQPATDPVPGGE